MVLNGRPEPDPRKLMVPAVSVGEERLAVVVMMDLEYRSSMPAKKRADSALKRVFSR